MTLSSFIKRLQAIESVNGGRSKVCIDTDTFFNGNGTWCICDVGSVEFDHVRQVDGDGYGIENKDGSERTVRCVVIKGDHEK